MAKKWSKAEKDFLVDNFDKMTLKKLAEKVGRGERTTQLNCHFLGLYRHKVKRWTKREEKTLIRLYPKMGIHNIAQILKRSDYSISQKCRQLKISKHHKWQKLDQDYVIDQYVNKNKSVNEISKELYIEF